MHNHLQPWGKAYGCVGIIFRDEEAEAPQLVTYLSP